MAAIDPSAPIDTDAAPDAKVARATLKLIRQPITEHDDEEDEDDDEYMRALLNGEESSDEEEEEEAGPSDPSKSKKARKEAALKELLASIDKDVSDEDMEDAPKKNKGKGKATEEEEESEEDSDDEGDEVEEFVICTLDTERNYQQTIDITVNEDEHVYFKVDGTHSVYLTGNFLVQDDELEGDEDEEDYDSEDDEDYDLSPDEDELEDDEDEEDDLDDLEDPRITELESEEEAPQLVSKKGKKRAAEEPAETLDEVMEKTGKQQKKQKTEKAEAAKESPASKGDKKVQFAKNLEQGPTGSQAKKAEEKPKAALGVKTIKGVKIDDKKLGSGPAAKNGDRVSMRYIGKLTDGKVFDANKKGKPFSFKLGKGEVIQGWDIGVAGMQVGGERRLTVPANMAYGSKALPGIPANSTLIFDVKCLEIK
jgi:FK506-binding nuclear protein